MFKTVSTQTKAARLMRAAVLGCISLGQLLTPAWAAAITTAQHAPASLPIQSYPLNVPLASMGYAQTAINLGVNLTRQSSSTASDSAISSANGNVVLKSGGDLLLSGAQVTAAPDKAITLDGRSVTTIGSVNYESDTSETKSKGATLNTLGIAKLGEGINAKNTTTNASAATSINRTSLTAGNVNVIAHLDEPLSEAAKAAQAQALAALSPAERAAYNDYQAKRAKAGSITLAGTTFNTTPAGTYGSGPGNTATGIVSLDAPGGLNFNLQQTTREASTSSAGKDLVFQKNKNQGQADATSEYVKINGSVALSTQTTVVNVQLAAPTQQTQTKAPKKDEAPSAATRTDTLTLDQRATEVAKQPGMAWLGQLQSDPTIKAQIGSVKYKEIEEAHKTWNYKQQGLTPEGAAIVAVVVTYFTAGAASGAATSLGMTTVNAAGATVLSVGGTAIAAGLTTLSVQAATAILNNNGDISAALKELGSKENVKGLLTAMVTAGALNGLNASLGWTEVTAKSPFTQQLGKNLVNGITSSLIGSAINGTPPEQALKNALKGAFIDTLAANGANAIGDARLDQFTSKLAHAMLGCATGAAIGDNKGSCAAGAIGAVVAELTAEWYNSGNTTGQPKPDTLALSNLVAQVAVAVAGGNASQIGIGGRTGSNAVANNYLNHLRPDQMRLSERERLLAARAECQSNPSSGACGEMNRLNALSQQRDTVLRNACLTPTAPECRAEIKRATDAGNILDLRTGIPYSPADGPPATIGPVRSPALDSYGYQQGGNLSEALIQESFGQVGVAALRGVLALGQVVVTGMRVTTNGAVEFVNGTGQVTARVVNGEVLDSAGVVIARQNPINPTQYTPVAGQPLLTPSGSFATAPNSAYFWSGLGRNGDTIAANIAGQNGGITLETLMLQRGISLPSWDATNPLVVQAWRNASGTYASAASGDVRVVLGPQVRSDSVWNTIEYDALRNNPNVTRIIQVDPVTGRQTILYRR